MNQLKMVAVLLAFVLASYSGTASAGERNASLISAAQEFIGLHESKDFRELRSLLDIDPRRIPWCAAFVNKILEMTGRSGTDSLMARSFLNFGERVRKPVRGDIVVLTRGADPASGHVGFYMGEEGGYVRVLGGNQQRQVSVALYPKSRVLGYRRVSGGGIDLANRSVDDCYPGSKNYSWTNCSPS